MLKSVTKKGRPVAIFRPQRGEPIVGLMRLGDGRWRASGPERYTFSEPDEQVAILHFQRWKAQKTCPTLGTLQVHANALDVAFDLKRRTIAAGGSLHADIVQIPGGGYAVKDHTLSKEQWTWLNKQLVQRPKWVAEQAGLTNLAYIHDRKPPAPLPSFWELAGIWEKHFQSSAEQKRKCSAAFDNFRDTTGIKELSELTPDVVVKYRDDVYGRGLSGKSQSNLFTRIRRYFSFFRNRAIAIDDINRALGYLALLTPSETTVTIDPKPIDVADWKKLQANAVNDDKAMIFLMLNCAMYLQEVIKLEWSDIRDGCLVTHRAKTGKCVRVAVLWKETLEAINGLPRRGSHLFYNRAAAPLGIKGAEKRFRDLRDASELPHVTSSMLRDGAYTAAVEANVTSTLCRLLVGHRCGLQDNYVKRKPGMVAPACEAIHKAYGIAN